MAFRVPFGYDLIIDGLPSKRAGEMSGGQYSLREVLDGTVEGWQLIPTGEYREVPAFSPPGEVLDICDAISASGGDTIFAGGVVRDSLAGVENKDIDVEVYGMKPDKLESVLSKFGRVDTVGSSFGIIKLTTETNDYDFSLPRRENKAGKGHRGFVVEPDENMTYEEAGARRDFTINAMSMTTGGRLIDYFRGLTDLRDRILRHTSNHFSEDPLRVLRGFQFASRFGMSMDKKTADLSRSLRNEYSELPKERVWTEWEKWGAKGRFPSAGIQVLKDTDWLELYPELAQMDGVKQDPEYHPEGDVLVHTMHVVDEAAKIAERENLDSREKLILMFAALCHDLGKPETTVLKNDRWASPGHAQAGEKLTVSFLSSIGAPSWLIENVAPLVVEHMAHVGVEMTPRVVNRIAARVSPSNIRMLSYVIEADHSGRPPLEKGLPEEAEKMVEMSERLSIASNKPKALLGGKDLFDLADTGALPEAYMRPGKHFGVLLNYLYEAQLDGEFDTPEEGRKFVAFMFDEEKKSSIEEAIDYIESLNRRRLLRLIDEANRQGLSEEELLQLPREEIARMSQLAVSK